MDYPPSTSSRYTSPTPPQQKHEYQQARSEPETQAQTQTQHTQHTQHAQGHHPHRLGLGSGSGRGPLQQGVVELVQPQDSALPLAASPQSPRRPPSSPRAPPGTALSSSGASGPAQPPPSNLPTSTPARAQEPPPCRDQQPLLSCPWSSSPRQPTDQEHTPARSHAPTAGSSLPQGPRGQSSDGRGQAQGRLLSPRPASSSCSDSSKASVLSATATSAGPSSSPSSSSSSGSSDTCKDHDGTRERGTSRPLRTGASQSSPATLATTSHASVPGRLPPCPPPFSQGVPPPSPPMSHPPPAAGPRQPQQQQSSEQQKHAPPTLQPVNYPGSHYHLHPTQAGHGPPPPPPQYGYPPPGQPVDQYRQSPTGPPPHSLALPSMRSFDHQQQQGQPQHPIQQHPQGQQYPHQPQQTHGQHAPPQYAQHPQHHPMGSTMAPGPHMGYFTINQQPYGMHDPMGMRYGLPPGLYDPRMQLSGGRHKKVRGRVAETRARLPVNVGGRPSVAACEQACPPRRGWRWGCPTASLSGVISAITTTNDGAESVKSCLSLFPWVLLTVGLGC